MKVPGKWLADAVGREPVFVPVRLDGVCIWIAAGEADPMTDIFAEGITVGLRPSIKTTLCALPPQVIAGRTVDILVPANHGLVVGTRTCRKAGGLLRESQPSGADDMLRALALLRG